MRECFLPKKGYRAVFVIGKGGVGKTTMSAAISLALAQKGYRTLVVSLDPAHNLGDVLGVRLEDRPREIAENLYASEVDMEGMIKAYLKHIEETLKHTYRYLTVINLEKYFEVLRYSPGIEEYATLEVIRRVLSRGDEWDVIIFDTPPTGLTLRVLALPRIARTWADKLIELRLKILDRRKAIEKIHGERKFKLPSDPHEDAVLRELMAYREEVSDIEAVLTDPEKTSVVAVMNPEMLPLYETERAFAMLRRFGIPFTLIVMNKILRLENPPDELRVKMEAQEKVLGLVEEKFPGVEVIRIPMMAEEPRGLEKLIELGKVIVEGGPW
ncbi:ArsA family ATPase [Pyrococcus yayanosii]|uniref:Anion transporting atpase n=1 Tax=Pyrococcus yayanosii (strain CH1 / JCM 16557) TaxID=529709 RepID=F8AHS0_PYRYC|nr:ArsA family ATPase [Pyrococcus yayanosii]AEH24203.1 anion transporting atpase [Pyrococcus yayanosii CH1]